MRGQIDERYEYQREIINHLVNENGYVERNHRNFDKNYALDRELLFEFLKDTQPDILEELSKIFGDDLEETIINTINNFVVSKKGSLLSVLKHGVDINNKHLTLLYGKPATSFNPELSELYDKNIFSVMEEVYPDKANKERVDLVIFINGFAVISFEIKSNSQGQNYEDAIRQYRTKRNPKDRLFRFKAGCLVNFAMDTEEVYMTTQLDKEKTFFLPFNMGKGEGVNSGAGNPIFEDRYSVSYMWEDILTKDTLIELITKFIFIESKEVKDQVTGRTKTKERIIFPRYHQLDVIRKILADLKVNKTSQNYLIQHSAGSGKTNSIAWLAHRLASLHDEDDKIIFNNIVIMTDRVVVDRQLQKAIMGIEHKAGLIRVMDDRCNSADLKSALESNTKIVVTTIQKFPYVVDLLKDDENQSKEVLSNKKFAVIIDEAHSSTAGKNMMAVTSALSSTDSFYEQDVQDQLVQEIKSTGKQKNVSMFAFTATPKSTTLRLFGRQDRQGNYRAFHLYSMKQAIEENFILDVLANYTTYETYYELNKETTDDPELKTSDAKRQIAQQIDLDDTNIAQRTEIIIEHFRKHVMSELGNQAKAMVVMPSRKAAMKYQQAFQKYIEDHHYDDMGVLVAFSGKVNLDDDQEYTESSINGISEEKTAYEFNSENYRFLLVANKYQVGFDQPKLTAMYIMKKIAGVNAVQTLSRLNRICPPYEKTPFVLDFSNSYEDIEKAFAPYYTTTLMADTVNKQSVYNLVEKIEGFYVIDPMNVEGANLILHKTRIESRDKKKLNFYFVATEKKIKELDESLQREIIITLRHFVRCYEFLLQVSNLDDIELQKLYNYVSYLLKYVDISRPGQGYDLTGKIKASNFAQKQTGSYTKGTNRSNPEVKLPVAGDIELGENKKEKLSKIIEEVNQVTGSNFDNDIAVKSMLQIRDLMMKSNDLRSSAQNNSEHDFELSYFDRIDDMLIEGLEHNKEFFTLLLDNDDLKKKVLGTFASEIYNSLRKEK
ncbi:type I restriction endonuclease subunit R [Ligilactobacillus aviarius]|uniref:Type I restriction endonuclease subunit R n=2 Tax=Lactobacillaceae TaxID=33958 RepID=A0A510WQM9_9LACO|nr:DEAD/DEAH box helicase family protein [Ligilactobacillus aviarius]KRM40016.1 type i restriction-modification system, restriction subunit r [Ligilactobacillus aviarius subsp. aviarius DSM 20655]GEK41524.1 type I restriction endonuclease subunit R [Ligilactobacillus aviarius]